MVCGGLRWFVVVCGGLRWFVVVCGGLSFSHTSIFVGRIVHILWPKREIRDVSAKNCGRNGSWPKRPVTLQPQE